MNPLSGGTCQSIRTSIPELEKFGVSNDVVSLDDPASSFVGKDNFNIIPLGPGKGPWCYSTKLKSWLVKNLTLYDVVIVHGLWLYNGYATYKAIELLKRSSFDSISTIKIPKLFIMPHGMLDPYFQRASGRKLKAFRNWFYWKIIESKLINKANGILFTSDEELQLAKKTFFPYHPQNELNIGLGIEVPPNHSAKRSAFFEAHDELREQSYFLFLSRIHSKKGVDLLIKAYKKVFNLNLDRLAKPLVANAVTEIYPHVVEKFPKLVIAGPGLDTAFGQKIQQLVRESKLLQENVIFAGMLSGAAKWEAFYSCEAFILPSHQENFGIAVVEALGCGKPVLISDQVNIWKEIKNERAGLVAKNTLEGTSELLQSWVQMSKQEKQEMGKDAKYCFEKNYAIGSTIRRFYKAISN